MTGLAGMEYARLSQAVTDGRSSTVFPPWALGALREVAEGRPPVRGTVHPLGFTCLPILRDGGYGVCVHIWSPLLPRERPTTSAVHAHSWHLTSYVLYGQLHNEHMVLREAGSGERPAYRMLEVRSSGGVDELCPTERVVRCARVRRVPLRDGDVYAIPPGTFHATAVGRDAEAATVVLGRMVAGAADLSLGALDARRHLVRRRICDSAETAAAAALAIDRLTPRRRGRPPRRPGPRRPGRPR